MLNFSVSGEGWRPRGGAGDLLLDVRAVPNPEGVQGSVLGRGHAGLRGHHLQQLLPVGAHLPRLPRRILLPAQNALAHDGGRTHEVLREGNNNQDH